MSGEIQKLLPLFARFAAKVPLVGDEGEAPPPSTSSRSVPAQLVIPSLPRGRPAPNTHRSMTIPPIRFAPVGMTATRSAMRPRTDARQPPPHGGGGINAALVIPSLPRGRPAPNTHRSMTIPPIRFAPVGMTASGSAMHPSPDARQPPPRGGGGMQLAEGSSWSCTHSRRGDSSTPLRSGRNDGESWCCASKSWRSSASTPRGRRHQKTRCRSAPSGTVVAERLHHVVHSMACGSITPPRLRLSRRRSPKGSVLSRMESR